MNHTRAIAAITLMMIFSSFCWAETPPENAPPTIRTEDGPGFVELFDGRSLEGWEAADLSWWTVEDNAITGTITAERPCTKNQYLFSNVGQMHDFELKLAHRIQSDHNVNCGFQFRSEHYQDADCKGYQIDNNLPDLIRIYDEFGRHNLALRGERTVFDESGEKTATEIPEARGEPWYDLKAWHDYHLICRGNKITLNVNGRLLGEVIDNDPQQLDLSGLLALQLHSGPPMRVQFRDIRFKPLNTDEPDPRLARWEPAIAAFEAADQKSQPPKRANLFVGSSSIRLWKLADSFPQHVVVNRGFGGSHVSDSLHFAERIVLPHAPRVVLVYAGDNDIAAGKSPERVANDYRQLVGKIHGQLPECRIVYICIKPSLARWKLVDAMREANRQIAAFTESDERLHYADIFTPMLGKNGQPREELFVEDGLHLNADGYRVWAEVIRPFLVGPE